MRASVPRAFSTVPFPKNNFLRPPTPKAKAAPSTSSPASFPSSPHAAPKLIIDRPYNVTYPQNQVASSSSSLKTPSSHSGGTDLKRQSLRPLFHPATFRTSVARAHQLPARRPGKQEIVFAGKSNVGKSSLINALVGSLKLVKTSKTAGQTRMLNYFDVPGPLVLVDAPGYGDRGRQEWGELFAHYITSHPPAPPSLLLFLHPLKHSLSTSDHLFLSSLPPSLAVLPVFTKCDDVPPREINEKRRVLESLIRGDLGSREGEGVRKDVGESVCVSTMKKFPLRDETLDTLRLAIMDHLDLTAQTYDDALQAICAARRKPKQVEESD